MIRIAADNPAGPPPTIHTSYIIISRGGRSDDSSSTLVEVDGVVVVERNSDPTELRCFPVTELNAVVVAAETFLVDATWNDRIIPWFGSNSCNGTMERVTQLLQYDAMLLQYDAIPFVAVLEAADRIRFVRIIISILFDIIILP